MTRFESYDFDAVISFFRGLQEKGLFSRDTLTLRYTHEIE